MKLGTLSTLAAAVLAIGLSGQAASAGTILPGDASVRYAANVNGYFVNSTGYDLFAGNAWVEAIQSGATSWTVEAGATAGNYADAGIVLFFDGSMTLGQLKDVQFTSVGNTTPSINLWLDSDNSGDFFAFSGETLTGLAGDSYFGSMTPGNVDGNTQFTLLGGPGAYGEYSLADLAAGARAGIDGNTKVALWIGVTNGDYFNANYAVINQVDVGVNAVPVPASAVSGFALLGGLASAAGLKRRRQQQQQQQA